jgi:hypothetical protein
MLLYPVSVLLMKSRRYRQQVRIEDSHAWFHPREHFFEF